jgi:DNA-binding SARP family transcriptional activator
VRTLARRAFLSLCVAILVMAIWLLSESRPPLPATARFATASGVDLLLGFIAWLGCLLIAVGLLYRVARPSHHRREMSPASIRHLHPQQRERSRRAATGGYRVRAFPLIPQPRSPLLRETPCPVVEPTQPEHQTLDRVSSLPSDDQRRSARISLLGPLTITERSKRGRRLRGATRELLGYLALHPAGAQRDQIVDALWPDQTSEQGRNRLWRAATDARTHLGDEILIRDSDRYQLNRAQISVDLDDLEQLLIEIRRVEVPERSLFLLERALGLFAGRPLSGSDVPWAESEQRRLSAIQLELLEWAALAHLAVGDPAGALTSAEHGLAREPFNEKLARVAMRAEGALGLRSAIIDRYERLTELLDEQLGLRPDPDTRGLYRQLLRQDASTETRDGASRVEA